MTIIETLNTDYDQYIKHCFDGLKASVSIFDIDNSKGETDLTRILFMDKMQFTKPKAMAILIMRLMMYSEEWTDYEIYTKEDVIRWVKFLEINYQNSIYHPAVSYDEFINDHFVYRLQFENEIQKNILLNSKPIEFQEFQTIFPTENNILSISSSGFKKLEQEYYLETGSHFMLFNWYTTA
jgi:hypothetical protein